jgi:uncharacterized membrane protein (DUF2068 family)
MTTAVPDEQPQLAPGILPGRRRRLTLRYELLGCALHGHALVGLDAAEVRPEDAVLARLHGPLRLHRCLRCDAWLSVPTPDPARSATFPEREHIELPLRGRPLRDRYVLRLIAIDRAIHVVVLTVLAVVVFIVAKHESTLRADFTRIVTDLQGSGPASSHQHGFLGEIQKAFSLSHGSLYALGGAAIGYAVLEAVEMIGLWNARRWAEYLTFLATILLLPIEIYELTDRISALKIITLLINLGIAIYLLLAKRLFGLRGGSANEQAERAHDTGWKPIEQATPP